MGEHTTIVRLVARDFQGLRAARVRLDREAGLVRVTGKNGAGKSSLLGAIKAALGGAAEVHVRAVRDGAEDQTAEVELTLSNGFRIRRKLTEANPKGYLTITGPDGGKYGQGKLDDIVGPLSFDPLAFFGLKPDRQREILLGLGGDPELAAKLDDVKSRRAEKYDERTPWISQQRTAAKVAKPEGERPEPVDVSGEMKRLGELQAAERDRQDAARELESQRVRRRRCAEEIADSERMVEELEERLAAARELVQRHCELATEIDGELADAEAALAELVDPAPAIEAVTARISEADAVAAALEPWKAWDRAQAQNAEAADKVAELTHDLNGLDQERDALIAGAGIPVEGLTFDESGAPLLNGRPLELASGGERIRLAVQVALAVDPALRICLVDEANDLDLEALAALHEHAQAHGFQLIVCRIGLEGDGEVMVADGVALSDGETDGEPAGAVA